MIFGLGCRLGTEGNLGCRLGTGRKGLGCRLGTVRKGLGWRLGTEAEASQRRERPGRGMTL